MKDQIYDSISSALRELFQLEKLDFAVELTKDLIHGDYASNAALIVGKMINKSSVEVAGSIVEFLNNKNIENIAKIEVAGPGFINFHLSREYFTNKIKEVLDHGDKWGHSGIFAGKKILVEHSSPNLFKPFHIGHLMNNAIGESITRLAQSSGANVSVISFPSDISLGIAKAIYIILQKYGEDFEPEQIEVLGDAYVEGTKLFDEDISVQEKIKNIANNLYEGKSSPELKVFDKCKKFNIDYFENITAKLGSKFDSYIYESEAGVVGKEIVLKNTPKIFTESEGAIVYIPEEGRKDINTSVFINSQGNPTYEAKDVGLLSLKFDRYNPDISLFVTDSQQKAHFDVVLDAVKKINQNWFENSTHITHGRMSFKGQKMSSRLGGVPLALDTVTVVTEEVLIKNNEISNLQAELIALSAIKFSILRVQAGKDINFDPDTSLSFEGDSGPYLQYTTVRANAVLEKAKSLGLNFSLENISQEISDLEKMTSRFPNIVERSITEWAPHHIVIYLLELSQAFNSWYANTKIVDDTNPNASYNLALTQAVSQTIKNGLHLLAIETPERM